MSVRVDRPDRRRPRPIFDTPNGVGAGLLALSLLEGENHLVGGDVAVLGFRISNGLPYITYTFEKDGQNDLNLIF